LLNHGQTLGLILHIQVFQGLFDFRMHGKVFFTSPLCLQRGECNQESVRVGSC
jgi:hypothetical protein